MDFPLFSLIIPTHNERENIKQLIPKLINIFREHKIEIIVIDDISNDGTRDEVVKQQKQNSFIRLIAREHLDGIGSALIDGYNAATGEYIVSFDADQSFPVEDIKKIADQLITGRFDLVLGSRYIKGSYYEAPNFQVLKKKITSGLGNIFLRIVNRIPVHDFSANCRGMRKISWHQMELNSKNNFMLFEMIWRAHEAKMSITEVPVCFFDRRFGQSKLRLGKEVIKAFRQLIGLYFGSEDFATRFFAKVEQIGASTSGLFFLTLVPIVLVFFPFLFGLRVVGDSTFTTYIGPYFNVLQDALRNHESIFWTSNIFAGFPTFATVNGGLLSIPIYLFIKILPAYLAYHWILFFDVVFAAFFTSLFLKKLGLGVLPAWIGGMSYIFSQWHSMPVIYVMNGLVITPALFLLIVMMREKIKIKYTIAGILLVAHGWFSVHWHFLIMSFMGAGFFSLYVGYQDRSLGIVRRYIYMIAGGTIIGLIQIIPAYILLSLSERAGGFSHFEASAGGLSFANLPVTFFPNFVLPFYGPTLAIFISFISLIFGVCAFTTRFKKSFFSFFSIFFIFTLILGWDHSVIFQLLHRIPPITFLHNSSRWMFLGSFAFAVLGALGAQALYNNKDISEKRLIIIHYILVATGALFLLISTVVSISFYFFSNRILSDLFAYFDTKLYSKTIGLPIAYYHTMILQMTEALKNTFFLWSSNMYYPLFFLFISCFVLRLYLKKTISGQMLVNYGSAILLFNFLLFFGFPRDTMPASLVEKIPNTVIFLRQQQQDGGKIFPLFATMSLYNRFLEHNQQLSAQDEYIFKSEMLIANANLRYNISSIDADEPLTPSNMSQMLAYLGSGTFGAGSHERLINAKLSLEEKVRTFESRKNIVNFLGIKFIISSYPLKSFEKVYNSQTTRLNIPISIYKNNDARPLLYFAKKVNSVAIMPDTKLASALLAGDRDIFIICRNVCPPKDIIFDGAGAIKIFTYKNGTLKARVSTDSEEFLVFSQTLLPGWSVFLDGSQSPIYSVGGTYMGTMIRPGEHEIEFKFSFWSMLKDYFMV